MVQSHPDDIPAFRNDGEAEDGAAHKCLLCHVQFPSVAEMQQHLRVCINTGRSFILSVQQLTEEQLLACQHPKPTSEEWREERHECQLCGENLKSAEFLKTHVDSHLTPMAGEIKCAFGNKCSLVFRCAVTLKEHRKEHYKALQCSCEVCGKCFLRKCDIKQHMVRHSKERTFLCDASGCSYMSKTKRHLQRHMTSKHCYVITTCHLCGKKLKADFLKQHFARHESETSGLLKCLYQRCKQLFQKGDDLREHTEQVHQVQKKFQCSLCGKWYASKDNVKRHLQWHSNLKMFKCDVAGCSYSGRTASGLRIHGNYMHKFQYFTCAYCGNKYKSVFYLKQHVKKHMTDVKGVFKCLVAGCKETFSKVEQLRKHVQQTDSHDSIKQFACIVCGQINPSKKLLDTHMLQHQVGKFACPVPGCTFLSKTLTKIHLHRVSAHLVSFENTCKLCGQGCYSAAQFQQHTEAHKTPEEEIIKCLFEECLETFSDPLHLRTHMKQHGNIHECDVPDCLLASSSEIELQLHKISMHSIWPQECNMCGRGFEQMHSLKKHVKYHLTDVPGVYKCLNCKETFTSEADLKKHVEIHKETLPKVMDSSVLTLQALEDPNSKANECSLCGKSIKTRVVLQKHALKHATQIPGVIKCVYKECDLMFTSAAQLKEHASITHWDFSKSEERSLACDVPGCNKSFKNMYSLPRHIRTVHSPTAWTCHLCGKNFKDAVYGARHVKTVHANQQQCAVNSSPIVQVFLLAQEQELCKEETEEIVFD